MIRNMAPTDLARVMELSEAVGLFGETELVELKAAASKHLSAKKRMLPMNAGS